MGCFIYYGNALEITVMHYFVERKDEKLILRHSVYSAVNKCTREETLSRQLRLRNLQLRV